ncbi:MAG: dynamin family protein [Methylococcaceae bacterium]|jgi:tRNA U34 5-carboxymethylaminomethyl modifying GTPase MnmE/TrmE
MTIMSKTHALKDNLSAVKARKVRSALAEQHPKIDQLLDKIDHIITQPITIAVMGEFSAGKSSFLNRLLGIDTLPISVLPKTATLTRLVYGVEPYIEIEYNFDGVVTIVKHPNYDVFSELQRASKINNSLFQQELERICEIRVFVNNPILTKFHLLDTPGFNHDAAMDEKSLEALENADLVFWIADYNQLGKKTEFEKLELIKEKVPLYLIVNKGDVHVSGSAAYKNTVAEICSGMKENKFINFFQSDEIFLISSKVTDQFWDGIFQQFLARISELILNADLKISLDLVVDQSKLLQKSLETELVLYKQLQQRINLFIDQNNIDNISSKEQAELEKSVIPPLYELRKSLYRHYQKCAEMNTDKIFSANMFATEYLIKELYNHFSALQNDYSLYFNQWVQGYRLRVLNAFGEFFGLLPEHHHSLRDRIDKIIAYYGLEQELGAATKQYYLPATDRTIKVLDQMGIRLFNTEPGITAAAHKSNWKLEFQVLTDGILKVNEAPKNMPFSRYVQLAVDDSIVEDYLANLNDIVTNSLINSVVNDINTICTQADRQISEALVILEE